VAVRNRGFVIELLVLAIVVLAIVGIASLFKTTEAVVKTEEGPKVVQPDATTRKQLEERLSRFKAARADAAKTADSKRRAEALALIDTEIERITKLLE
jgi:ubiquitin